jgi:hypothetical protein
VKNSVALARQTWDAGLPAASGYRPRAGAGRLSPRLILGALIGDLVAAIALFGSGVLSPILIRSLQLFLRF